jgi:LysR family transcriptional regulator, regulator for metE and metH
MPPPVLETRHFLLLLALEETGSLHAGAKVLHVTPSALSQQLKELEARLGGELFIRQWRRLHITAAGRFLTAAAHAQIAELRRLEAETRDLLTGATGMLRIATACHQSYRWLGAVLKAFSERWPGVEVTIVPEATTATGKWLTERKLDVALVPAEVDQGPHIRLRPLFRDELVALVGREHPWSTRRRVAVTAFADQHLWADGDALRRGTPLARVFEEAGGVAPRKVTIVPVDGAAPLEMARANLGICIMPRWSIEPALRDRSLKAVSLGEKGVWLDWALATRDEPMDAPLAGLVDLLCVHHPRARSRSGLRRT